MTKGRGIGHPLGVHRVLNGSRCLPQAAQSLDASLPIYDSEAVVSVAALQIDAASFRQLQSLYTRDEDLLEAIEKIIRDRGKMVNPVTGSGGMLLGTLVKRGEYFGHPELQEGDKIATLVSLTATPLHIDRFLSLDREKERVLVEGHAILFASSLVAKFPTDLPEGLALAAFDVCGAPALATKQARRDDKVLVIGLGKAGLSVLSALRLRFDKDISLFGVDCDAQIVGACRDHYVGEFITADAQNSLAVSEWVMGLTGGRGVDLVINTTSVAETEMSAILSTRHGGKALFFGMATNFAKTVLGAESVGRDIELIMGSGYTKGHADLMLSLLRTDAFLCAAFIRYANLTEGEVHGNTFL